MHHGVTFNFGSAKVCSPAIFEISFSYDKNIWIAATDYYMHFYIVVLFPFIVKYPYHFLTVAICWSHPTQWPTQRCEFKVIPQP